MWGACSCSAAHAKNGRDKYSRKNRFQCTNTPIFRSLIIPNCNASIRGARDEIFLITVGSGWAECRSVDCASAAAAAASGCSVRMRMVLHKRIMVTKENSLGYMDARHSRSGQENYLVGRSQRWYHQSKYEMGDERWHGPWPSKVCNCNALCVGDSSSCIRRLDGDRLQQRRRLFHVVDLC